MSLRCLSSNIQGFLKDSPQGLTIPVEINCAGDVGPKISLYRRTYCNKVFSFQVFAPPYRRKANIFGASELYSIYLPILSKGKFVSINCCKINQNSASNIPNYLQKTLSVQWTSIVEKLSLHQAYKVRVKAQWWVPKKGWGGFCGCLFGKHDVIIFRALGTCFV